MSTLQNSYTEFYAPVLGGTFAGIGCGITDIAAAPSFVRAQLTKDTTSFFHSPRPKEIVRRGGDPNWDVNYDLFACYMRPIGQLAALFAGVICTVEPELRPVGVMFATTIGASALYEGARYVRNRMREKSATQD